MMMAVGLSQFSVGLFHLVTHACFKALLFMAAGSVIHAMADQQDLRRLGGLAPLLPFTYAAMLIGSLSLMALPGLTGYYSKDHLLELAMGTYSLNGTVIYWAGTLAAGLTAFYSIRLIALTFFGTVNGTRQAYDNVHEAPVLLGAPLVFLAVLSVLFGYMAKDLWLGMGTDYLSAVLPQHPSHVSLVEAEFALPVLYKQLPLVMTLLGAMGAVFLYGPGMRLAVSLTDSALARALYGFINGQWRWNAAVTGLVITPLMNLGYVASKVLDRGLIETVGPYGLSTVLPNMGRTIASYDTSVVTNYALYIVLGFLSLALMVIAPLVLPGVPSASVTDVSLVLLIVAGLGLLPSVSQGSKS
jgi:NADH-ubiquinone oxidoreductase chain 5